MYNLPMIKTDEILHSYLYRIHDIGAHYTLVTTLKELLGNSKLGGHMYLPEDSVAIYYALLNDVYESPEDIVINHSLFNYYTAFSGKTSKDEFMKKIIKGHKGSYKVIKYNEIPISQNLRFCPECLKEQKEIDGDFAWNRLHQIIPICTKHHVWIQESTMPTTVRAFQYNQYATIYPVEGKEMKGKNLEIALDISRRIEEVVFNPVDLTDSRLRDIYRLELNKRGLLYTSGVSIRKPQLKDEFEAYIGTTLLQQLGVDTKHMKCINHTLDKYQYTVHPLYHILMQSFLNINLCDLPYYTETMNYRPEVTCYCMNPLSQHYKKHIIDDIKVHYCSITKKHMCTFFVVVVMYTHQTLMM